MLPLFVFLVQLPTQLVEFRRLRRLLTQQGFEHKLFVESSALLSEPDSEILPVLEPAPSDLAGTTWLDKHVPGTAAVTAAARAARRSAHEYLMSLGATALIVGEDGVGGNLPWIAEATRMGLPVYILPYEFSGRRQVDLSISAAPNDYALSGWFARLFSWVRPRWSGSVNGQRVFRLPLRFALGYEVAGVAPKRPWTVHGGKASLLLAESARMVQHYTSEGVARGKVVETGTLALDDLHSAAASKINTPRLSVLCALPPDYTSAYGPGPYAEEMQSWVDLASQLGDVTIQAHPAARERLTKLGFAIDSRDIATLIGHCDVLVTSVSSIIRLALAAGKPVVNYDLYKFGYDDYTDAKGVRTMSDAEGFRRTIESLAHPAEFNALRTKAVTDAARWGTVDGLAHLRLKSALGLVSGGMQ